MLASGTISTRWPATLPVHLMSSRLFLSITMTLLLTGLSAQQHDRLSFMGYGSSIVPPLGGMVVDFRYSPPRITKQNNQINFYVSAGSCSDSSGHLLYYTNGIEIRNALRNRMQDGDSINAISYFWKEWKEDGYPSITPMFSVPFPGHPHQYVLFHQGIRQGTLPSGILSLEFPLMHTLIDMNQNSGQGRVISKNQMMVSDSAISTVVVKHGNGRDWWVISGIHSDPSSLVFLLSDSGLHGPFVEAYGPAFLGGEDAGLSTISPDGRTYVRVTARSGLRLFDFDRCTGRLTNLRIIPYEKSLRVYSALYSADSRFLYLSYPDVTTVMDMWAPDPALTLDTIAYYDGFATPLPFSTGFFTGQLHEDGKIYYATTNSTLALHVIHHPELPGLAANLQQHGITLPVYNDGTMCRFPNYRLGRWAGSPCDTLPFAGPVEERFRHLPYEAQREPDTLHWRVLSPLRGSGLPEPDMPDPQTWLLQKGRRE